jgi:hypothetical protein
MTPPIQNLLDSYNALSEAEQREFAIQIMSRTGIIESRPLSDEALVEMAEQRFQALDAEEANDVDTEPR